MQLEQYKVTKPKSAPRALNRDPHKVKYQERAGKEAYSFLCQGCKKQLL